MISCDWLPQLEEIDFTNWNITAQNLYKIYYDHFVRTPPIFKNKLVYARDTPNYKHVFEDHFIKKEVSYSKDREIDIERCKRIKWIKAIIENYQCKEEKCSKFCSGIKIWPDPKKKARVLLLFEEVKYLVVLEERYNMFVLITAYYLDYERTLEQRLKQYKAYKQKAPSN